MQDGAVQAMQLQRVSTVDAVVMALREQIFDGHLPRGQMLREGVLCTQFGVSRHSMRVALATLSHEGLLRHEPNRGVFVRTLSRAEIEDCFRMRRMLELEAAKKVCGDRAALAPARRAVEKMLDTTPRTPWTETRDADLAFHEALVDALGSAHMSRAFESLVVELRLCFLIEGFKDKDQKGLAEEHLGLLEALEGGNLAHSTRLLAAHLDKAENDAIVALAESEDSARDAATLS
ncbi:GntR family transcriptional regulator [Pseudonocardia sp. CA-107938]|uniref:GntR family transcriptional regulator n=1 Tax=Pseudonocardia sp. CA-107938 TaxID=3240021 RepID=UPI003D8AA4F5